MSHLPEFDGLTEIPESIDRVHPLGETAPAVCPKCHHSMELGEVDDHHVLLCQGCRGILVQSEIFAKVVAERRKNYQGTDSMPQPIDSHQLNHNVDCPGCGQHMSVHPYHGPGAVVIDSCPRCWFTFLDYGELSSIEKAPGRRH